MSLVGRLILVFFVGILLSCQRSIASEIAYSIGPQCSDNEVVCSNPNEVPTCLVLNPRIHQEYVSIENSQKINRYSTVCIDSIPTCFDQIEDGLLVSDDVIIECIEFAQCVASSGSDKLTASCSKGKMAKCLGSENEPNCSSQASNICEKGIAVCDYTWQANLKDVPYQ